MGSIEFLRPPQFELQGTRDIYGDLVEKVLPVIPDNRIMDGVAEFSLPKGKAGLVL